MMTLFINKIISSVLQILVFALIPFVWWLVTARKKQKFTEWIGLKKMEGGKKTFFEIAVVSVCFLILGVLTLYAIKGTETATSEFAGLGAQAIPAIIVYAVFNTALPEEVLFRGFLLKRMANKFGFTIANLVQAVLFGLMHGVMFISIVGVVKAILIIALTGVIAWFMGYINEKQANGSIVPSWIIHTVSNVFSGICSAFMLI